MTPESTAIAIDVVIADGEWGQYLHNPVRHAKIHRVGLLPNGTVAGAPAFELLARTSDGGTVLLETTWATMRAALKTLEAGWPDGKRHVSELAAAPPVLAQPSDLATFTAGWLVGVVAREAPDQLAEVEEVDAAHPATAAVRMTSPTGRKLLVTVTEEP